MANHETHNDRETEIKLTNELILAYDPAKAEETLNLITATRQFLERHFNGDADNKSHEKVKPLSYTQLRNILLEVKKHEQNLGRIIPKLAYMEAKLDDNNQKKLVKFIRELLETAIRQKKDKIFIEYMDMLVAFHKYYSSSKKQ